MNSFTPEQFAARIDHTILKPEASAVEVHKVVTEATQYQFASVCVAPVWISRVAVMLRSSGALTCAVIGFPHGTSKSTVKAIEASSTIKDGADEIDIVAHLPYLAAEDYDAARAELLEIVRAARSTRRDVVIKVIVESAYLLSLGAERGEAAIAVACRAVRESGCDFIKTSTGFHPAGGASIDQIQLMKKYGEGLLIKASGGIRDLPTAQAMLDAGADRLGMSASMSVIEQLKKIQSK
jgi:deoxyribose-phosphate aldolase